MSIWKTHFPGEFPRFQRLFRQSTTQPHDASRSWNSSRTKPTTCQKVAGGVGGGCGWDSIVYPIVTSEETRSVRLVANDCEKMSSHRVGYSENIRNATLSWVFNPANFSSSPSVELPEWARSQPGSRRSTGAWVQLYKHWVSWVMFAQMLSHVHKQYCRG